MINRMIETSLITWVCLVKPYLMELRNEHLSGPVEWYLGFQLICRCVLYIMTETEYSNRIYTKPWYDYLWAWLVWTVNCCFCRFHKTIISDQWSDPTHRKSDRFRSAGNKHTCSICWGTRSKRWQVKTATGHNGDNKTATAKTATHNSEPSRNGDK